MPTEPSKEAVEALHDAIFAAIEPHAEDLDPDETHGEAVKRVLHRELPAIHQRWEQEVRERLEVLDRYVIGTAYMGGHYQERTIGKMYLMNSGNARGEKGQWVKRSEVLAIFGEAEEACDECHAQVGKSHADGCSQKPGIVQRKPKSEAEPVEGACTRCDGTGWLCAECKQPQGKCICGVNGASENGCPDCKTKGTV